MSRVMSNKLETRVPIRHSSLITHYFLRVQSFLARFPFSLAKTTSLQCLNDSQRFFSRTSDVEIVNHLVAEDALGVDNE